MKKILLVFPMLTKPQQPPVKPPPPPQVKLSLYFHYILFIIMKSPLNYFSWLLTEQVCWADFAIFKALKPLKEIKNLFSSTQVLFWRIWWLNPLYEQKILRYQVSHHKGLRAMYSRSHDWTAQLIKILYFSWNVVSEDFDDLNKPKHNN